MIFTYLADLYWIHERDELTHNLVRPPVGRMRPTSGTIVVCGKAHPTGARMRQMWARYNAVSYNSEWHSGGYFEVTAEGTMKF